MKQKQRNWWIIVTLMVLTTILSFSPLVIPNGQYAPKAFGMPYTLWVGILVTIILVCLTYFGTLNHPGEWDD